MKRLLLMMFLFPYSLLAQATFTLITIPKSGSHLVIKALHLLTGTRPIWHTHFPSFWCIPPDHGFLYTHFCLSQQLAENYRSLPDLKQIIAIRDLRDVAISMVGQIKKGPWPGMTNVMREQFLSLPFDEQLLYVIEYEYDVKEVAEVAPHSSQASLIRVAEQSVEYANDPSHFVVRYEDLVGPLGGGTLEAQTDVIRAMANFIEVDLLEEKLFWIASQLYGDVNNPFGELGFRNFQSTFSNGQIGVWASTFKEEHKIAFKRKLGAALIALGYEQDDRW